ncbi:hypothetical protein IFM58399_02820 [Aspergillus lentulus]|uniref:Uncharacterized protein n=1 Tax=Aspergillus lentulus TaxID=293939 RepID=A0ABQ1AHS8_ASPLE|nr:uncharacterized protein IFM58399_02820 [Aspergillus lentulus]GFF31233.1 hypothetical protein IFM58399_02820 [Aspergillus lentulus]GFF82161.1 hypothetical protein IFM60648_06263 [Aspergillus lentulus]GFF85984.1 hypothetical protein IFM47457_07004 [Aspergillus lentulus]GFG06203.1 hypothetical protein IFM61392_04223 [Aspergillus lentulus]
MHNLRDSLLSPSPRGTPHLTTSEAFRIDQEDTRQCTARGEFKEIRSAAFSNRTWIITSRYCELGDGVDSLEKYIHSMWYMYYQLGRNISYETPDHEGLVLDIVRIQGMGPLTRPVRGNYGADIARTAEGTLWNDLPFLATDMTNFWNSDFPTMSGTHRLNFATFLAKLASTRVGKDRLCQIALILFRNLFEESQGLCSGEESDDEDPKRSMHQLEIFHLLPAAVAWLRHTGHNLILLSEVYWNECPSTVSKGGEMFTESELGQRSPTGFSPWRYIYWLKRLHEIQEEAKEAKEELLEEYATDAIDYMLSKLEQRNSEIFRAYQNGGDALHQEKHLLCLKILLKSEATENKDLKDDSKDGVK